MVSPTLGEDGVRSSEAEARTPAKRERNRQESLEIFTETGSLHSSVGMLSLCRSRATDCIALVVGPVHAVGIGPKSKSGF